MSSEPSIDIRFIDLDDYQLAVHVSQKATGNGNLILLHGAAVASESTWYPMPPVYQSFRYIPCPDLRGMGRSHAPEFEYHPITVDAAADEICEFLTKFSVTYCQIVCYRFGGLIASMVNALYPGTVSDLVLLEPSLFE